MTTDQAIIAPTCEELIKLRPIRRDSEPWRHGTYETYVYKRDDGTYWQATFERSTDGEVNGLRSGDADIVRVYPHEVVTIEYRVMP